MCPSIINYITAILQASVAACEGDGGPLRKLMLQSLNAVGFHKVFRSFVTAFNITPDEVRDSEIFTKCNDLELMQYLVTNYKISKDDAVKAFYGALRRESLVDATWLADQFQFTKQDLFPTGDITWRMRYCGNLDFAKWLVEKYQFTLDDLGAGALQDIARSNNPGLVRWMASTYKFERDDVVRAFLGACDEGNIEIVKFLAEFYQLTADEILRENRALKNCGAGHLREWLLDNYYTIN